METTMQGCLEAAFHDAMMNIYRRAKSEVDYNATRFLRMVGEQGGHQAALTLLHSPDVSEGYTALWELGRLDLTVEALILQPEWQELFTDEDRARALTEKSFGDQASVLTVDGRDYCWHGARSGRGLEQALDLLKCFRAG